MRWRGALLWINRVVWTLLAGGAVLLGSLVSLGHYYLPNVHAYQRELVAAFNRRTGLELSVGRLSASWHHLSPHFVVDDLRLRNPNDPQQTVLKIAHAELQLGLFRSIAGGTIAISRLRGRGVHLQLDEATLGHWQLAGFGGPGTMSFDRVVDFLAAIYRADLSDTTIDLHFFGGGEAHLTGRVLRLQRSGDFRRLNLALQFAGAAKRSERGAPLRLVVETRGDPRMAGDFSGRGYIEFRDVDLTPILPVAKAFGIDLEHGRVDGEAWLKWRAGGAIEVYGNAEMPQFDLSGVTGVALAPVKNIKTEFLVRDDAGRRRIWLPQLTGIWHGVALKFPRLSVTFDSAQPQRLRLALSELQLTPLARAALADGKLPPRLHEILAGLAPQGTLHDVQLDLPLDPKHLDSLRLRADFDGIAVQPWHGAPGLSGASGYVDAGPRAGLVDLVSNGLGMSLPHLFSAPLHFDRARGQFAWRVGDDRVLVDSGPIALRSDAGHAAAQVSLDLPLRHGAAPLMTLRVGLRDSAAKYRDRFIPTTLHPDLLQWLHSAIGKGAIPIGGFVYRGSLLERDHIDRSVQLFLQVRDGELAYRPDWPPLHDLRAAVWVDNGEVHADVPQARLYDHTALTHGSVDLRHDGDLSWLTVNADAAAGGDDVLKLLRATPLREHVGSALDHWHWQGTAQSHVELGIAVAGSRPPEVNVNGKIDGGTLTLADQNITLNKLQGAISYRTGRGLNAAALSAQWFGKPIAIKVATQADGALQIGARGSVAMSDLQRWLQQPLFGYASGETPFAATLRIVGGAGALRVQSDLAGVGIDLPPPYRKTAAQKLPLTVDMTLGTPRALAATLGDWADLHLRWGDSAPAAVPASTAPPQAGTTQAGATKRAEPVEGGVLRLGHAGKTAFGSGQFVITGSVPAIDLGAWGDVLRPSAAAPGKGGKGVGTDTADRLPAGWALHLRQLHFDSARIAGQTLRDLTVSGQRSAAGWTLQLHAARLAGTLIVPDKKAQPWRARLDYLRLPEPQPKAQAVALLDGIDPRHAPALDLRIDHVRRGGEDLGWVEGQLRPVADGLRFDHIKGKLRAVGIEAGAKPASLIWTRRAGDERTVFSGKLAVDDIATALRRWHFEPVLTSKRGFADVHLAWPGRPDQFRFTRCDGSARLQIDDGRFLRASGSATGALKVVGIFNFANFLRRLQLNFSDIFKDGVSFDRMSGALSTRQGVLKTDDPIEIKSPSSRFRLAGHIDFNTDQTDMELIATLPVASNLPWLAALAGGLPAAAGAYVASKVFEHQFDKFSSAAYRISGPWTDPKVKLRRVFDDKLPQKSEPAAKSGKPAKPTKAAPESKP